MDHSPAYIVSSGNNLILGIAFACLFLVFILIGYLLNGISFKNYIRLFRHSGRLVEDFVLMDGFPLTLTGSVCTIYNPIER
jgi:hypothetical protein